MTTSIHRTDIDNSTWMLTVDDPPAQHPQQHQPSEPVVSYCQVSR